MTIHEPATVLTDCLLGVLGCWFALRLRRSPAGKSGAGIWWSRALALMAASAFAGGTYHGFAPEVPPAVETWWWRMVLWLICGLGLAMGMSLLHEFWPDRGRQPWTGLLALKFALAAVVVFFVPVFAVAMADYGLAMLAWAAAALVSRRAWSGAMLAGVALSAMAGAVQRMEWGVSVHFNHNDVFHVIQALALVAFHRGGMKLTPAQEAAAGSTA